MHAERTEFRMGVRKVELRDSHSDRFAAVDVVMHDTNARLEFNGYWHSASMMMTHDELARVRDAINAVLIEAADA